MTTPGGNPWGVGEEVEPYDTNPTLSDWYAWMFRIISRSFITRFRNTVKFIFALLQNACKFQYGFSALHLWWVVCILLLYCSILPLLNFIYLNLFCFQPLELVHSLQLLEYLSSTVVSFGWPDQDGSTAVVSFFVIMSSVQLQAPLSALLLSWFMSMQNTAHFPPGCAFLNVCLK